MSFHEAAEAALATPPRALKILSGVVRGLETLEQIRPLIVSKGKAV